MKFDIQWILSGGAALVALACGYAVFAPQSAYSVPTVPARVIPDLPAAPAPFLAPPESAFAIVAEKPLFDQQRKKYVPPPVADKAAPPPPPNLSLVGVIIDSDKRLAMVKSSEGALASSVAVGAQIAGWQVAEIEPDRIVLKAGTAQEEVRLDANKAPPQSVSSQARSPSALPPQGQRAEPASTPSQQQVAP
jgi:hypothetical protein